MRLHRSVTTRASYRPGRVRHAMLSPYFGSIPGGCAYFPAVCSWAPVEPFSNGANRKILNSELFATAANLKFLKADRNFPTGCNAGPRTRMGMGLVVRRSIPLRFQGGVAAPFTKKTPFLSGTDGGEGRVASLYARA